MHFLIFTLSFFIAITSYAQVTLELKPLGATHYNLELDFAIDEYDGIYEQYLSLSIDDPAIALSSVTCSVEPTLHYAPAFKTSKPLYLGPCSFSAIIDAPSADHLKRAHLYATYRLLSGKHSKTVALALLPVPGMAELKNSIDMPQQVVSQAPTEKTTPTAGKKKDPLPTLVDNESIPTPPIALPLIPLGTLSLLCALLGLFLLFKGSYAKRLTWRPFAAILGMALIACSIVVAEKAYQAQYQRSRSSFHIK